MPGGVPMTDLDKLKRLLAEAIPGPWEVEHPSEGNAYWRVVTKLKDGYAIAFDDGSAWDEYNKECSDETRDLIVAAINALPSLLSELESLRAENAELRAVLGDLQNAAGPVRHGYKHLASRCVTRSGEMDTVRENLKRLDHERNTAASLLGERNEDETHD